MKIEREEPSTLDVNELITKLIGLWPACTARTNAADGGASALRELGRGVRRALENVLQDGDRENLSFRLYSHSAMAEKPLVTALAWALAMPYRRARELPYAPLVLADATAVPPQRRIDRRIRTMSIDELVDQLWATPKTLPARTGDCALLINQCPAGVMLGALFGLAPTMGPGLRPHDGRCPEELARGRFEDLATEAVRRYTVMREPETTVVPLTSETDAAKVDLQEVRANLVTTLLAAALLAASGYRINFSELLLPPDSQETAFREMATGRSGQTLH